MPQVTVAGTYFRAFLLLVSMLLPLRVVSVQNLRYDVYEKQPVETIVATLTQDPAFTTALPPNIDPSQISFNIRTSSAQRYDGSRYFRIEDRTGIIRILSRIDRDSICPYRDICDLILDVTATSAASRDLSLAFQVTIRVLDINDHYPTFTPDSISFNATANPTGNVFPLPAADDLDSPANGVRSYRLVDGGEVGAGTGTGARIIDGSFGLRVTDLADGSKDVRLGVRWTGDLRVPAPGRYTLAVEAVDGGSPPLVGRLTVLLSL